MNFSSFLRGSVEVRCGDWLLVIYGGKSIIGLVREIVELYVTHAASAVLRMLMSEAREVMFEDEMRGQVITVKRDSSYFEQVVCVENASVLEVSCNEENPALLTYEYVY